MEFTPAIGLEIHAELKTRTKMFCDSANDSDEKRPNQNICPICLGHPGTLPTINKEAVKDVLRVGLALGAQLADYTEFERKSYFYPDLPKGYQISQYKYPLVIGGRLAGVALTRIHLEEDTGRLLHDPKSGASLVDFNRAGVPLMELVTEPVVTSAKQAADFARELQLLLRYLGASEANMEKGELRVEANVSVAPRPPAPETPGQNGKVVPGAAGSAKRSSALGTKVEIKNLNSFRSVERAIEYEIKRQNEVLGRGDKVTQETRGWDDVGDITFSQREKESAHDYRYFTEPDLPPLKISEIAEFQSLEKTLPELPWQKRERYSREYGIKPQNIEVFVANSLIAEFFDIVAKRLADKRQVQLAANYLLSDAQGLGAGDKFYREGASYFVELIKMADAGEVSSRGAKDLLAVLVSDIRDPRQIAKEKNLFQKSDEAALQNIVKKVLAANPQVAADYQEGRTTALQFLIGQGMKESKGAANPEVLTKLFKDQLK